MNYIYAIESTNDALSHHGTKGQKWGVRRYQNYDGSLTEAGVKRYFKQSKRMLKNEPKINKALTAVVSTKPSKRGIVDRAHSKDYNYAGFEMARDYNKGMRTLSKYLGGKEQAKNFVNDFKSTKYKDLLHKYDPMQKVTESAVDDMVSLLEGTISKKQFNKKYSGTGFKVS